MLLSERREVVEGFLRVLARAAGVNLDPVPIAVDAFVKTLARVPDEYVFSFIHTRVSAFGTSLKSISFYGEDVAEAKFFRDGMELFVCHTCGIRHVTGGPEIMRLGNDGAISFKLTNVQRLIEVEIALRFLRIRGYLTGVRSEERAFE